MHKRSPVVTSKALLGTEADAAQPAGWPVLQCSCMAGSCLSHSGPEHWTIVLESFTAGQSAGQHSATGALLGHATSLMRAQHVGAEARAGSSAHNKGMPGSAAGSRRRAKPGPASRPAAVSPAQHALHQGPECAAGGKGHLAVVAATSRPAAVDASLRRPGRLDQEILLGLPDLQVSKQRTVCMCEWGKHRPCTAHGYHSPASPAWPGMSAAARHVCLLAAWRTLLHCWATEKVGR